MARGLGNVVPEKRGAVSDRCDYCHQFFSFDPAHPPLMGWFCLKCDYLFYWLKRVKP